MPTVLTLNSGSSSLNASLFCVDGTRRDWCYGHIGQGFPRDHAPLRLSWPQLRLHRIPIAVIAGAVGAFAAKAGGIGEHAPQIRERICEPLGFLGLTLDAEANQANTTWISAAGFKPVLRLAADEETVIRDLVVALLGSPCECCATMKNGHSRT